jgi:prepilin-type N-terminal cleavage/methylation domain-containing protein
MSRSKSSFIAHPTRGFSLVELLIVVAVIAILAGVALPNLAAIPHNAHYAKSERNAQAIASLAAAARAAGATNQWSDPEQLINDLEGSLSVKVGTDVVEFKIDPMSEEDREGAVKYLAVDESKAMVYYKGPESDDIADARN